MARIFTTLRIVASVALLVSSNVSAQQFRVAGYYPMWSKANLPPSAIRYEVLTHIIHAVVWPDIDGSIVSWESGVDTALINTTHRAGRKILLSFGGVGATPTANFSTVLSDPNVRQTFINNIITRLLTYQYDGVDLDWEGPAGRADMTNEVLFVQQLRPALQALDPQRLLTMAIPISNYSGQWHDYLSLEPFVDWFNAMEYDIHGSWSSVAGHNAPLYAGTDPTSDPDRFSVDQSIHYLTVTRSIPKGKLVLGVPFYGKSFGTTSLYTPYTGEQDLAYRDIMALVQGGGWTYSWDSGSQVPLYTSTAAHKLMSLDDSASVAMKCTYAVSSGLVGVMIWEITQDVIGQKQPLLDAIGVEVKNLTSVSADRLDPRPAGFALGDSYPNPVNPSTTIPFVVPSEAQVRLVLFDILGRKVATLLDGRVAAGAHSVRLDGSSLASGVYCYRLESGRFVEVKKLMVIR
jgi:chitinase